MGLKTVYSEPTALQLLEGNGDKVRGYAAGINALTVDGSHRLRDENSNLKQTLAEWARNRQEMAQIRKELEEIKQQ